MRLNISLNQLRIEIKVEKTLNSEIERLALKYHQNPVLAKRIIMCESHGIQSKVGTGAVVGVDIGLWQINTYYNLKDAERRGFDIYNWEKNLEYGFVMLSEQGVKPWHASRSCWLNEP